MAELRRTGAFDRAHLLIQAPAGSGYANSFPVDILEVLTRGDCAAVAVGYGLLPSFLSMAKVEVASHTQRLLLDAIREELSVRDRRPRLLLYGESLGAKVQEAAVSAGPLDLDHYGVSAALWVGTPGGEQADIFHALCAGESYTVDRPEQLPVPVPGAPPARVVPRARRRPGRPLPAQAAAEPSRLAALRRHPRPQHPRGHVLEAGHHVRAGLRRHDVRHQREARTLREPRPRLPRRSRRGDDGGLRPAVRRRDGGAARGLPAPQGDRARASGSARRRSPPRRSTKPRMRHIGR